MDSKLIIFLIICGFVVTVTPNFISSIVKTIRNTEYAYVLYGVWNCTKNAEYFLLTPETAALMGRKLIEYIYLVHYADTRRIYYPFYEFYNSIITSEYYDRNLPMVIIMPGWLSFFMSANYKFMAEQLRNSKEMNVIIMETGILMNTEIFYGFYNTQIIGEAFAKILAKFYNSGFRNFHIIGYGMGVYAASATGRYYESITNEKLDRITALDPLRLCINVKQPIVRRLSPDDAKFVDVIHTEMDVYGLSYKSGHVDFYPNGGFHQPACGDLPLCTHMLSAVYFGESLQHDSFLAVECKDWETFLSGACANNTQIRMGYRTNTTVKGKYFLKTDYSPPFTLGYEGIVSK